MAPCRTTPAPPWGRSFLAVLVALPLTLAACSDKSRPVKGGGGGPSPSGMGEGRTARPTIDPARPGPSQAERSISQAMAIKRAEDALAMGQPERALEHLKSALALLPSSPRAAEIHLLMGRAHELSGARQLAVAAFERAVALEPGNPAGHYLLALSYKASRDFARAHAAIAKAIDLAPMNLSYRFDRVTIELGLDRKLEAERSFTEYEKRRDDLIAQMKARRDPGATPPSPDTSPDKPDDRKRLLALSALAAVPADERILDALVSVLGDPSAALRTAAAQALGDSGSAAPRIRKALVDQVAVEKDAAVRKVLREALTRLPEPATGAPGGPTPPPTPRRATGP